MQRWSNVTLRAQQALPRRAGREATEPGDGKRRGGSERRRLDLVQAKIRQRADGSVVRAEAERVDHR